MKLCEGVTTHDALIIGSGLAGMAAAIEAHDAGARVAILSKVHPLRSHSQAAQGGINAAIRPDDDWRDHRFDTIKGSAWLADQDAVTVLCREAPDAIWWLAACGVPFSRTSDGLLAQRPFGGQRRDRTCYAADKTGHDLLHTLYEQVQRRGITVYEEFCVTRLVPRHRARGASMGRAPTRSLTPATAWPWPGGQGCPSRTWSSSRFTPRASSTAS